MEMAGLLAGKVASKSGAAWRWQALAAKMASKKARAALTRMSRASKDTMEAGLGHPIRDHGMHAFHGSRHMLAGTVGRTRAATRKMVTKVGEGGKDAVSRVGEVGKAGMDATRAAVTKVGEGGMSSAVEAVSKVGEVGKAGMDATRAAVTKVGEGGMKSAMEAVNKLDEVGKAAVSKVGEAGQKMGAALVDAGDVLKDAGDVFKVRPLRSPRVRGVSEKVDTEGSFVVKGNGRQWQQFVDEVQIPSLALTAAEREERKKFAIAEDEWDRCPKWLWFPVSPTRQAWDFMIMLAVIYLSVLTPYRASFEQAEGAWFLFESCIQIMLLFDVAVNFNTPILASGQWRVHRPTIAKSYLSSWFWIDFPPSIPIEVIERTYFQQEHAGLAGDLLPMLRALRLLRLLRLLSLLKLDKWTRILEARTGVNLKALHLIKTVVIMLCAPPQEVHWPSASVLPPSSLRLFVCPPSLPPSSSLPLSLHPPSSLLPPPSYHPPKLALRRSLLPSSRLHPLRGQP